MVLSINALKRFMKKRLYLLVGFIFFNASAQVTEDTLKIGVYESPPFVIYKDSLDLDGVSAWLWGEMKQDFKRPYKLIQYNSEHPLKDILQDLESGKIDFSINPLTITNERHRQIDFTYPFYIGSLTMAKKSNSKISSVMTIIRAIFNYRLLYLVLVLAAMVALFGVVIWLIEKKNHHFERGWQGLLTSFWWSAVTMTTVGYGDKVPISHTGRFVAFIWMLCSLIIISIFTASITSNLTVHKLSNADLTLDSYRKSKVGTVRASATEDYLKHNFFHNISYYPEFRAGLDDLNAGHIEFFVYDEPWLNYQLLNNPNYSELELVPVQFNVQLHAMPMRKQLPLAVKNTLTASLLKLMETRDWRLLLSDYQLKEFRGD